MLLIYFGLFTFMSGTRTHTNTWLTGKLSLMASTGAWKGHAKWCFHNGFNTSLSRYWKRETSHKKSIKLTSKTPETVQTYDQTNRDPPVPVAGWSVVWACWGSMFQGVEGWRGEAVGQREGSGCCLPPVRLPSRRCVAVAEQTVYADWTWQGQAGPGEAPSGHYTPHSTLWRDDREKRHHSCRDSFGLQLPFLIFSIHTTVFAIKRLVCKMSKYCEKGSSQFSKAESDVFKLIILSSQWSKMFHSIS